MTRAHLQRVATLGWQLLAAAAWTVAGQWDMGTVVHWYRALVQSDEQEREGGGGRGA